MRENKFPCIRGTPVVKIVLKHWRLIRCRLPDLNPKTSPRGYPRSEDGPEKNMGRLPTFRERRYYPVPS